MTTYGKYLRRIYFITVLAAIIAYLIRNYQDYALLLSDTHFRFHYAALSFMVSLFLIIILGLIWREILFDLSTLSLSIPGALLVHFKSWIGKYLPAKAGLMMTKIYFATQKGIPVEIAAASTFYENVFSLAALFLVSIPLVLWRYPLDPNLGNYLLSFIGLLLILLLILTPRFTRRVLNPLLAVLRCTQIPDDAFLGYGKIVKHLSFFICCCFLSGLSFYFTIRLIYPLPIENFLHTTGIITFAGAIGMLAIFAPSGIGVKESVIVLLLKDLLPMSVAIMTSVLSRAILTLVDLFIYFLVILLQLREPENQPP